MVVPTRVAIGQSARLTAAPKRVVLPLMNDMKSWENSRNPMASAQPASADSASAKGTRVPEEAGNAFDTLGGAGAGGPSGPSRRAARDPPVDPSPTMHRLRLGGGRHPG